MSFVEWGREVAKTLGVSTSDDSKPGADAQKILDTIIRLGGEVALGQLKDETELSYLLIEQGLKQLRIAALVEFDFSSSDSTSNPVLVYRLK